jgi:adenylyltransferase/sulfurtransferase
MQAMEAIKLVAQVGEPISGLATFDAKTSEWKTLRLKKDPGCRVCAQAAR